VGYITRGRGVSVHRGDCPNITYYRNEEDARLIEVGWGEDPDGLYQAGIEVIAGNRERLTIDIMAVVADTRTNINAVNYNLDKKTGLVTAVIKLEVKTMDHLDYIINRVKKVRNVIEARRIMSHPGKKNPQ
ncbi:MAG: (p)ppGpp synthetase, partial [Clostridiales bacterium]|nr:(p)ppGpp synthetase [Clostridiales bacterium]